MGGRKGESEALNVVWKKWTYISYPQSELTRPTASRSPGNLEMQILQPYSVPSESETEEWSPEVCVSTNPDAC